MGHGRPRLRAAGALTTVLVGLAVLMAGCATGGDTRQASTERAPVPVKVAKVAKGAIAATLSYSGELQPVDQVDLLA